MHYYIIVIKEPFKIIHNCIVFYCIRMHCSRRLIVQTLVFSRSYLHRQVSPPETLVVKGGTTWARNSLWILPEYARLPRNIQGSFTCLNLRHGTNGFTSFQKEGVLRIFSPWKIRRLQYNKRSCVCQLILPFVLKLAWPVHGFFFP